MGYDVAVDGSSPTCQSLFPAQACSDFATGLSRGIQGALGVGIRDELNAFVNGTVNLGFSPGQVIF